MIQKIFCWGWIGLRQSIGHDTDLDTCPELAETREVLVPPFKKRQLGMIHQQALHASGDGQLEYRDRFVHVQMPGGEN